MLNSNSNFDASIFTGTRGSRTAKIMTVAESYGKTEKMRNQPLVGETGKDYERLLAEAKIPSNDMFYTNVVNEQPAGNDMKLFFHRTKEARLNRETEWKGLYPKPNVIEGLRKLKAVIAAVQPELIIGLGNYTLWALTDDCFDVLDFQGYKIPGGIGKWRGSQLHTSHEFGHIPFLPTYHPAAAFQTHAWRYMIQHDLRTRVKQAFNGTWEEPSYDFTIRPSFEQATNQLLLYLQALEAGPLELVLDLETSISKRLISCIGFASSMRSAICIPFLSATRNFGEACNYWLEHEEVEIVFLIRKILAHPNLRLIGHNLLFDLQYIIDQLFVRPVIAFDTMIGQHTLWPGGGDAQSAKAFSQGIQRKALWHCSSLYCAHHKYWKDEGKDLDNWSGANEDQGWNYNCKDCVKTFEVAIEEKKLLAKFQLETQCEFQHRVANEFALEMMINGIPVNKEQKRKVTDELGTALETFDAELYELMPEEIRKEVEPKTFKKDKRTGKKIKTPWYTSSKQQGTIFYDLLGIKPVTKGTGADKRRTLDKNALPIVAQREPLVAPIVDKLEIRRSIGVYHSTFAEMEEEPDGRARCSYNVTGTDTFRFSSSENIYGRGGNFQNIPSGKEDEGFNFPNMRGSFEPSVGYEIAEFDLSGADAQVVASTANDLDLIEAFQKGIKIHLKNARDLFPEQTESMTDDDIKKGSGVPGSIYDSVKKGVHATNYGAEPPTLASRLRWKLEKAEEFQERWFYVHPEIRGWHLRTERCINGLQCWRCFSYTNGQHVCPQCSAATGRTIGNKFGYRIVYFDHISELRNKALAWEPQSTVAICCNKGAIALRDNCPWVRPLLQVHDSLVVEYPIRLSDRAIDIKKALHQTVIPFDRPLTIPWSYKASRKSWGECETVEW